MSTDKAEVAILGAGIAGCSLAYHLARRGVGPVVVIDPSTPAAGASGRAAGIVTEQLWNLWDVEVARASKLEYAELAIQRDPSAYWTNGFARWTRQDDAVAALERAADKFRDWNVAAGMMEVDELAGRIPAGRFDDIRGAIYSPDDGVVAPSGMTEIYATLARQGGAEFWLGRDFAPPRRNDGRWEVDDGARQLRAPRLVVAAGAWSKKLLARMGYPIPLCPYRTQAAILRPDPPEPPTLPSVHDIDHDVYARPEANGRILAGDGTEHVEADPETFRPGGDDWFVAHIAECFGSRLPGWADAELVRAWAGVCCATPDRRPLIGPISDATGLFVVTGFNGFGVMRAAGVAQRLSKLLAAGDGSTSELDALTPVLPSRFPADLPAFPPRPGFTLEDGDDPRF